MPQICVITPVYNTEKHICRCVDSILAQTFTDFELILVDDGSPDNCGTICDEYASKDARIHVIHQENQGQSSARNHALDWMFENSDSEWITFIDSDDWVHPQYLEFLISAVIHGGVNISVCQISRKTDFTGAYPRLAGEYVLVTAKELYLEYAQKIVNVSLSGKLFNKQCFERIRLPEGKLWEDLATCYKLILPAIECAKLSDALYYYYVNEHGTIHSTWKPQRMDEFDAYEEQLAFFASRPDYRAIYETLQGTYIRAISYSYFMEQESDLPPAEKKKYTVLLQKKMRTALRKYGRTAGISFQDNTSVYDTAYPRLMQLYWIIRSILDKYKAGKE